MILTNTKFVRKKPLDMKLISRFNSVMRNNLRLLKITGQAGHIQARRSANCAVAKLISRKFVQGIFLSLTGIIMEA